MFVLANSNASLLQYSSSPSLHLDHAGEITDVRLKLQELVPHFKAVPGLEGAGSEDPLKEHPGVVVLVQMGEVVEVGQDEFGAGAELTESEVKYPMTKYKERAKARQTLVTSQVPQPLLLVLGNPTRQSPT